MTKPSMTQAPTTDAHSPAPIVQVMAFDANKFASNWEQSESFLKALRYERLQLQKRVLNKINTSGMSVLEQGLLLPESPPFIKKRLIEIIRTFSKDEQIQFLRAVLIKNPQRRDDLRLLYPELDAVLAEQFRLSDDIQTASLRRFFQEYPAIIADQTSTDKYSHWIKQYYEGNDNILVDAIETNDFNLLKEVFNITAILNQRLLLDCTDKILNSLTRNKTFTSSQKSSIKQMLIELMFIYPGDIQQIPLSRAFVEKYCGERSAPYLVDGVLATLSGDSDTSNSNLWRCDSTWKYTLSSLESNLIKLHDDLKTTVLTQHFRKLIEIHLEYYHGVRNQAEQDRLLKPLWTGYLAEASAEPLDRYNMHVLSLKDGLKRRDDHSLSLLHANLDESNHLLGLLQTVDFVRYKTAASQPITLTEYVSELAKKVVANKSLWYEVIANAQDDRAVIVYLLKLLSALATPMGETRNRMVPESDVLALLDELLELFNQYPDQIEQFLTKETPPPDIALKLLFLLPLDQRYAILTQNERLHHQLRQYVTTDWCYQQTDLRQVLNVLMLFTQLLDEKLSHLIITRIDGDLEDPLAWSDVTDLTRANLNTLYTLSQWHQKPIVSDRVRNQFFNQQDIQTTLQEVIKNSLQDTNADVRNKAIGLFFLLPASLRTSLFNSGESTFTLLLGQALPKTEAELSPILGQVIQNEAEDDLISVLNARERQQSELQLTSMDAITNPSGENVRFRLQRSIILKSHTDDLNQQEVNVLIERLDRLNSNVTTSGSEHKAFEENMLLCATMLFDEYNRDAIKDHILEKLKRPEWLKGLEHARPHQIRTLLLTLMSLEKDLPSNYIAQYEPFFTPVLKDVRLFLESETSVHQTSNALILDLLLLLPAEQQLSLLKDKPILKKRISEILNKDDWYQQQISNKRASSFFKAWVLLDKPDWPLVDFKTMDELCDFLTELKTFSEDRRMAFLSRTLSTKNKNNIWSHIREQILKNTELLLQNNSETQEKAFGKLIPIFLLLTDAERRDVLSFETYTDGKKIKACIGDALLQSDVIKKIRKAQQWKTDYDEYRVLYQELHKAEQLVRAGKISKDVFPWLNTLLNVAYPPPIAVSKTAVAKCLLNDNSVYSVLSLDVSDKNTASATIQQLLLNLIKELSPSDQWQFLNQTTALKPMSYCLDDALINSCKPVLDSSQSYGYVRGYGLNQILQMVLDLEKKDPRVSLPMLLKNHPKLKSLIDDFLLKSDRWSIHHISDLDSEPLVRCLEIVFEKERRFERHTSVTFTLMPLLEAIYLNKNVSDNVIETFLLSALSMMLSTLKSEKNGPLMLIELLKRLSSKQAYNVLSKHDIMLDVFLTGEIQRIFDLFDQMDGFDITQQADVFKKFDQKIRKISEAEKAVVFNLIDKNPMVSFRYHSLKLAYESQTIFKKQYTSVQEQENCLAALDLYKHLKPHQSKFTANNSELSQALLDHLIDATHQAIVIGHPGLKQTVETIQTILLKQYAIFMQNTANKAALETLKSQLLAYGNNAASNLNLEQIETQSPNLQGLKTGTEFCHIFLAHQDNPNILKSLAELVKTLDYANQRAIFNRAEELMSNALYPRFLKEITPRYDAPVQDVSMNDLMTLFAESMEGAEETPIKPTNVEPLKQSLLDKTAEHGNALEIVAQHQPASFKPLFEAMTSLSMDAQLEIIIPIIERFETLPKDIKEYLKTNVQFYQIVEAHARKIRKEIELQILEGRLQTINADWTNPDTIDTCYQIIQRSIKTTPQTNEEKTKKVSAQNILRSFMIHTLSDTSKGSLLLEWGKKLDPKVLSHILFHLGSMRRLRNRRVEHVSTLFALINVAYKPDRSDLISNLSDKFLYETESHSDNSPSRDVTISFLQHLFKNIKQLPIATQAYLFEKMHRNPAMRCFADLSNEAKRDFHLIELAHKVHELDKKSIQGTDRKKKEHYQSAKSITQNLHDILLKISIEHDQTSTMTKDQSSLWFSSIEDARKRLAPIQKNLFNMNNLFQRLWHSMERILGLTSVTKEHLFTELNRYHFLKSPAPSAPCTKGVSESELFSKKTMDGLNEFLCVIRDESCNRMPEGLPLLIHRLNKEQRQHLLLSEKDLDLTRFIKEESNEIVKKHLYLLRLEYQLFRSAGVCTLNESQLQRLSQLHDELLSELTRHEKNPLSTHEIQQHQVKWNNNIQVCMAELKKEANQSSWLSWLFPSKDSKAIAQYYKQFIQEMENDLKPSNPLNQRR